MAKTCEIKNMVEGVYVRVLACAPSGLVGHFLHIISIAVHCSQDRKERWEREGGRGSGGIREAVECVCVCVCWGGGNVGRGDSAQSAGAQGCYNNSTLVVLSV